MAYQDNIQRFKASATENLNRASQERLNQASQQSRAQLQEVAHISSALGKFSSKLGEWHEDYMKKQKEKGERDFLQAQKDKAKEKSEVELELDSIYKAQKDNKVLEQFADVKAQDTRFQQLKKEYLNDYGEDGYPDADRLAKLSPWAQVGYAKAKLTHFNQQFPDLLQHEMQHGDRPINLRGTVFTAKELQDNNINDPKLREAALQEAGEAVRQKYGINQYSDEILRLTNTEKVHQTAIDSELGKYRKRYNVESSMQTRSQASIEWQSSAKTGEDFQRLILINSNTVDKNNTILGNSGGLAQAFNVLAQEGIEKDRPDYALEIGNKVIPDAYAAELGVPKGTTYAQKWPNRFAALKSTIKDGIVKKIDKELKFQQSAGKDIQADFIQAGKNAAAQGRTLTTKEVNEWKRKFTDVGLPVHSDVTKYETATMQDQRESEQLLESLFASQQGRLTREQLENAHPLAAAKYWDKLEKWEAADLKAFGAEDKIKGHLNTVWTNMGLKGNEKSPAYIEAFENAKADYERQYNDYIAMGHTPKLASYWALRGKIGEAKNEDGSPILGAIGVLEEIESKGANNKYTRVGQSVENELKPGAIRVGHIKIGKEQMRDNPDIINDGIIGGYYGRQQLNSIKENIDKHGTWFGLRKDKGAQQYYEGLARGRTHDWMGLVDAQLKADGHPGLWPNGRPSLVNFFRGKDDNEQTVVAPEVQPLVNSAASAGRYPSPNSYIYQRGLIKDGQHFGSGFSYWDDPNELAPGVF